MSRRRATQAQVLDFCNRVREAGGGELLPALLPGNPGSAGTCLIARNLNFECEVAPDEPLKGPRQYPGGGAIWFMYVEDAVTRRRVAEALGLRLQAVNERRPAEAIRLPAAIARVAVAFDIVGEDLVSAGDAGKGNQWLSDLVVR